MSSRARGGSLLAAAGGLLLLAALSTGGTSAKAPSGPAQGPSSLPSPPVRRQGWYGVRWGNQRPPELPADAFGAGDAGGARNYGLALARRYSPDPIWLTTIDTMGKKESGWTTGRPADAFGGSRRSWGVFQYLTSAVESEPAFKQWQDVAPWFHPAPVEIGAPIERFRAQWNEAEARSNDLLAPVAGVFLWQAAPAWRRRYWAALEQGADWYEALGAATTPKPEYQDVIAKHVLAVADAGAWSGPATPTALDDLVPLSQLRAQLEAEGFDIAE